jgi:hypothetical protein
MGRRLRVPVNVPGWAGASAGARVARGPLRHGHPKALDDQVMAANSLTGKAVVTFHAWNTSDPKKSGVRSVERL